MKNNIYVRRSLTALAFAALSASFVGCASTQTTSDEAAQAKLDRTQAIRERNVSPDRGPAARTDNPSQNQ